MIERRSDHMRKILIITSIVLLGMVAFKFYNWLTTNRVNGEVSIDKDDAKSLAVVIQFGAGNLQIEGGATQWMEGNIDTSEKKWYPSIAYKNKRNVGQVEIIQKGKGFMPLRKQRNDWHLQLTEEVPVSLDLDIGVSDTELNLAGIRLNHLAIDAGVGDTTINLDGDWAESFDGEINLGVGSAEIHLPQETGVKLSVSKGLGGIDAKGLISKGNNVYVNEAYEHSDVAINLKVDVGVGGVKFLVGN